MNRPFCERYAELRDSIRERPPGALRVRHGTDGQEIDRHPPVTSTTIIRIRAAVQSHLRT